MKNESSIRALGKDLKNRLFKGVELIFIFLYVSVDLTRNVCWANCRIEKSNYDISIIGLLARETELLQMAENTSEGLKLQDKNDTHGEYMILGSERNLLFYSKNGLFNELKELEL